jgi:hypothetical protein
MGHQLIVAFSNKPGNSTTLGGQRLGFRSEMTGARSMAPKMMNMRSTMNQMFNPSAIDALQLQSGRHFSNTRDIFGKPFQFDEGFRKFGAQSFVNGDLGMNKRWAFMPQLSLPSKRRMSPERNSREAATTMPPKMMRF